MLFPKKIYLKYKRHKKLINEGSHSEIGVLTNFLKWKKGKDGYRIPVRDDYKEELQSVNLVYLSCNVYYVGSKSRDDEKYMGICREYEIFSRKRFEVLNKKARQNGGYIEGVDIVYDPNDMRQFETNDELEDARNSC